MGWHGWIIEYVRSLLPQCHSVDNDLCDYDQILYFRIRIIIFMVTNIIFFYFAFQDLVFHWFFNTTSDFKDFINLPSIPGPNNSSQIVTFLARLMENYDQLYKPYPNIILVPNIHRIYLAIKDMLCLISLNSIFPIFH